MGRTAMQFYGRDASYSLQDDPTSPSNMPQVNSALPASADTMTWQQRKNFGTTVKANGRKPKGVHWRPLDLTIVSDPPLVLSADNSATQEIEVPIVRLPGTPGRKAAAAACKNPSNPPSVKSSTPNSTFTSDAKTTQKKPRKKLNRNRKIKAEDKDMASLPKSAYVPPHLRKRATAALTATTNEKAAPCVKNGVSTASAQSKIENTDTPRSLLNGANQVSSQLPSAPTTPREQVAVKAAQLETSNRADSPQDAEPTRQHAAATAVEDFPGWHTPKPEPTPAEPKRGNPNWPRGPKPQPRKTVWPKARDMKAMSTDSSSDGGIACRSDSNGDPDYDVKKLMDWNGDWLPPPEQWAARKGHINRHFGQAIEHWINGHDDDCTKNMEIGPHFNEDGSKELVPRYWIITKIEQDSLGTFWRQFPERAPAPVSDIDLTAELPYWERYEDGTSSYLNGLIVPEASVDLSDPENHMGGFDLLICAAEKVRLIEERKTRAHARTLARQRRPLRESVPTGPPQEDRRIRPKSNVYFRPVQPADVTGIAAIYNHYVETSIYTSEFDPRNAEQISMRIDTTIEAGLPFLVAVARGNQPKGPKGFVSEKIVGYASLDDWTDQSSIYRYTFELELYVHPGYTSQNIASCLLDRLLEMANTGYNARGGYDYRNDFDYLKTGPSRVIKTIVLLVHKEHGEKTDETSKFLKQFNFSCAGHIAQMGFKLGKVVDLFFYRHTTTEIIDPNGRPTVAL